MAFPVEAKEEEIVMEIPGVVVTINDAVSKTNSIDQLEGSTFVLTGAANPNMAALTGYTTDRARVYHQDDDRSRFLNEIDRVGFFHLPVPALRK
uniref:Uncharacterized protein n=1 Tax=Parascaris equorum TaxID=6256 RepID=A0A914RZ31_PAREQ